MMSSLPEFWDPLARLLLQALLHSLWQGALMAGLIMLWFRARPRLSATTRHAVWLLALLALAVLPLLTAITSRAIPATVTEEQPATTRQTAALPAQSSESGLPDRQPEDAVAVAEEIRLTAVTKSLPPASLSAISRRSDPGWGAIANRLIFSSSLPQWLVGLWLLVAVALVARIISSWIRLQSLQRALQPEANLPGDDLQRLAYIIGIRRRVRIGVSSGVPLPLTTGWWRPRIILPADLSQHLSPAECESVIAHELAHIKRCDYPINLLQRLIQACLFFHPAVWLICRQMAIERELACDDWAVRLTGEPRRYAGSLARLAELLVRGRVPIVAPGIIFGGHMVSRRIEMLLDHQRNASTFVSGQALSGAASLLMAALFVCVWFNPVVAVPLPQDSLARAQDRTRHSAPVAAVSVGTQASPAVEPVVASPGRTPAPPAVASVIAIPDLESLPVLPESMPGVIISPPSGALMMVQTPEPAPVLAPAIPAIDWWDQDVVAPTVYVADLFEPGRQQSAIPENELLKVLSEIALRDADMNVRQEALRGIYRLRSDASVDALIQLYDSVSDAKIKGEIIGYLLRRNGDNAKATARLVAIAKAEKDEELQRQALRQLLHIKGDEGAAHLTGIYDSLQESRTKQTVIRYLAANKSKAAMDKLLQIAQNDPDPAIRQLAIRTLAGAGSQLELMTAPMPARSFGRGMGLTGSAEAPAGSSSLASLYSRRAELSARLSQLRAAYSENHPNVKEAQDQLKALDEEINRLRGR